MDITNEDAQQIEAQFNKFFPESPSLIRFKNGEIDSVSATIQGPIDGDSLMQVVNACEPLKTKFSIYRSGTGLTIKFVQP